MNLTIQGLKDRYLNMFGEATRSNHRQYLVRRIVWRLQANDEGGLPERARRRAMELASDADLRKGAPRGEGVVVTGAFRARPAGVPTPGTVISREYRGRTIAVRVLDRGVEYEGKRYRSLSAVANAVTGSHWNGHHFFGLRQENQP
jgi:hypothetical protein